MRKALIPIVALALTLSSCASYTVDKALARIEVPVYGDLPSTKLADIEAEKAAEAERQRIEDERLAAIEAEERQAVLDAGRNDYPADLSTLSFPHVYRPVAGNEAIDEAFTRIDCLLLPLGDSWLGDGAVGTIADSVRDTGFEFVFVTGCLENQCAFATALGMDAITLEGGTICFTTTLEDATASLASFTLAEGKDIDLMVFDLFDDSILGQEADLATWTSYLDQRSGDSIAALDELAAQSGDSEKILALSSSEPSSLDWSIFTPYSYRTDRSWPISEHLAGQGFSDTYRATHFSEETDSGVTLVHSGFHERMDAFYTKGLIEVSSWTVTIPVLSEGESQRFATAATYIVP